VARGLETSGQRFLWVVRRPPGDNNDGQQTGLDALLPEGFLARTRDRGAGGSSRGGRSARCSRTALWAGS
jgi:hypothetical protein